MGRRKRREVRKKKLSQNTDKPRALVSAAVSDAPASWPQFRGPKRDGRVNWLPSSLPDKLEPVWEIDLPSTGVGGICVGEQQVIIGSRDPADRADLFQAFSRESGELLWQALTPAVGQLDYGNSPRATPLIYESLVITFGAFGDLSCIDLETGIQLWHVNFQRDFGAPMPDWGFCGSPIIVDEQLIVQPGASDAALAALDIISGEVLWKVDGAPAVYASLVQDGQQVIGLDKLGIAGWSASDGKNLWRITPSVTGDFGVPSVVPTSFGLLLASENNGTRLVKYDGKVAESEIIGVEKKAAPDSHTPVVIGNSAFVADKRLYCLSLDQELKSRWVINDRAFRGYTSLIASQERLLALTAGCELLLVDIENGKISDRLKLSNRNMRTLSHPALVGSQLYVRLGKKLMRLELSSN